MAFSLKVKEAFLYLFQYYYGVDGECSFLHSDTPTLLDLFDSFPKVSIIPPIIICFTHLTPITLLCYASIVYTQAHVKEEITVESSYRNTYDNRT